jgi:hypothetical protein
MLKESKCQSVKIYLNDYVIERNIGKDKVKDITLLTKYTKPVMLKETYDDDSKHLTVLIPLDKDTVISDNLITTSKPYKVSVVGV